VLTYTVSNPHGTTFIVTTSGWYASVVEPTGCQSVINTTSPDEGPAFSNVTIAVCRNQAPGAYNVYMTPTLTPTSVAAAAYVFPNAVSLYPSGSATVSFTASKTGTFTYNAISTDQGTTPPDMFYSKSTSIQVSTALQPTVININGTKFDVGQSITLTSSIQQLEPLDIPITSL
jgi:hypothetical protein